MENLKWRLVLGSQSPRRKELLGYFAVPFDIIIPDVDEACNETDPVKHSQEVARRKSTKITQMIKIDSPVVVVAADTVVFINQEILGKPSSVGEARQMLLKLSGKTHTVCTALSLKIFYNNQWFLKEKVESSHVTFSSLSEYELEQYLKTGESLDKAGAYGIQGAALRFIPKIEGCYSNVVGFPMDAFNQLMKEIMDEIGETREWTLCFL